MVEPVPGGVQSPKKWLFFTYSWVEVTRKIPIPSRVELGSTRGPNGIPIWGFVSRKTYLANKLVGGQVSGPVSRGHFGPKWPK